MYSLKPWPLIWLCLETEPLRRLLLLFSHSVLSDSLWPHGLQHTRLPCPLPSPRVFSNSCPLSQWCHPTISFSTATLHLSQYQGLFRWVDSSHQVAKVLEFQLQHQSFSEYSGLLSFQVDWFDLLAVQGTQESSQHHNLRTSVLWYSSFFMVQLSHYLVSRNSSNLWSFLSGSLSFTTLTL